LGYTFFFNVGNFLDLQSSNVRAKVVVGWLMHKNWPHTHASMRPSWCIKNTQTVDNLKPSPKKLHIYSLYSASCAKQSNVFSRKMTKQRKKRLSTCEWVWWANLVLRFKLSSGWRCYKKDVWWPYSWGASRCLIALLSTFCLITSFDLEYHADKWMGSLKLHNLGVWPLGVPKVDPKVTFICKFEYPLQFKLILLESPVWPKKHNLRPKNVWRN